MSDEQDNLQDDLNESASVDAASAGADDLSGALNESGDTEFIVEEEKKPANRGSLVLFGLVLAGVGLTYLMFLRTGPKAADAALAAQSQEASNTINTFLNDGGSNIKLMETMLKST